MKRLVWSLMIVAVVALVPSAAAQEKGEGPKSVVAQTPEWQKLKTLVGQWEGFMEIEGQKIPARVEVRMTGDGRAVATQITVGTVLSMATIPAWMARV